MHLLAQLGLFTDRMTDFPALSYSWRSEIRTLSYTWSLKRVPLFGWSQPVGGHHRRYPPTLRQCFVAALTPIISPRYKVYPTPSVSIFFSFTRPLPTLGFVVVLSISFLQFHDQAAIQYPVNSMMVIVKRSLGLYPQLAWPRWKWNNGNLAHF